MENVSQLSNLPARLKRPPKLPSSHETRREWFPMRQNISRNNKTMFFNSGTQRLRRSRAARLGPFCQDSTGVEGRKAIPPSNTVKHPTHPHPFWSNPPRVLQNTSNAPQSIQKHGQTQPNPPQTHAKPTQTHPLFSVPSKHGQTHSKPTHTTLSLGSPIPKIFFFIGRMDGFAL